MPQGLNDPNAMTRLDAALTLAQAGDFSGFGAVVEALKSHDGEVRIRAAYCCERIGCAAAIDPLSRMVTDDSISDNRNQAMFALVAIGRPSVVPHLIAALNDEEFERREDARVALYRVVGKVMLRVLADEEDGGDRDPDESRKVAAWWTSQSAGFDSALVYALGELAGPRVFIRQLRVKHAPLPDAYLDALRDWTGQDFGQSPLAKVAAKWEKWWAANNGAYEPGRRYFYGHAVP
jgi:hypothetical protein